MHCSMTSLSLTTLSLQGVRSNLDLVTIDVAFECTDCTVICMYGDVLVQSHTLRHAKPLGCARVREFRRQSQCVLCGVCLFGVCWGSRIRSKTIWVSGWRPIRPISPRGDRVSLLAVYNTAS